MVREQSIPVHRSELSAFGSDFDNMHDKFDAEMKRVEEEMARLSRNFQSQFWNGVLDF